MAFIRRNDLLGLTLEQGTENTPDDEKFHLFLNGELVRSFRSKKAGMAGFDQMRADLGFEPPKSDDTLTSEQKVQQERVWMEYYRSEEYWGSASSFRSGGKLRNV